MNSKTNANADMKANMNHEVPIVGGTGPNMGQSTGSYKSVTINIGDDPANSGRCLIEDPGSITLWKKNKEKITWCVVNTCQAASQGNVIIDYFREIGDPNKKNPFGDGSPGDNTFNIPYSDFNCEVKTKEGMSGGRYKYNISIKAGGTERGSLDPEVIISTME